MGHGGLDLDDHAALDQQIQSMVTHVFPTKEDIDRMLSF